MRAAFFSRHGFPSVDGELNAGAVQKIKPAAIGFPFRRIQRPNENRFHPDNPLEFAPLVSAWPQCHTGARQRNSLGATVSSTKWQIVCASWLDLSIGDANQTAMAVSTRAVVFLLDCAVIKLAVGTGL
jgi:hypothetical protein